MLDIGWSELAIIVVVALFVIGPKELPRALRTMGRYAGKMRAIGREFQSSIDEAVRETELDEVRKQIESVRKLNIGKAIDETIDPKGQIRSAMQIKADKPESLAIPAGKDGEGSEAPATADLEQTASEAPGADTDAEAPPAETTPKTASVQPMPVGAAGMGAATASRAADQAPKTSPTADPVPQASPASRSGPS